MAERTRRSRASGGTSRRSARNSESEGRLNRDYGDEEYREPGEGYDGEEPTKGLYTCELVRVSDYTSQDGNESVKWLFRLADGSENKHGDDVSGWMDSQYTTENTAWKEQQMLVALGVIKPGGKVNLPYDGIVKKAKPCTVRVGVERVIDEEGEGTWRGRMQAFLPLRDATAAKRGTSKRSRDDEDAEDVFEGDEDGDDEEEPPARSRRSTSRSRRRAEPEPEPEDDEEEEEGDEAEEGDEEDYDPDALAAELEDLSLAALKKRAREEFGVRIAKGMKADEIIEAVLDTLGEEGDEGDEDEEDAEDEEEEPPPPPRRSTRSRQTASRSKSDGGKARSRRARGSSDEPPF